MSTSPKPLEDRVSDLEKKVHQAASFEMVVRMLTMIGAVCVFGWGLYQHFDAQQSEFRKAFWEKRYQLYSRASKAAAKIAMASDLNSVTTERAEFWELYWGELSIVENRSVHDAMVDFGENLAELERKPEMANGLKQLSYFLSRACRKSLKETWEPVPLDDIPEKTEWSKNPDSKK